MLASTGGSLFRVSPCFHIRGRDVGSGEVAVVQRRVPAPEPAEDDDPAAPHGAERWHWLHLCRRLP
jgi:hypothetical protein